nr:sigma-54-dependent Fis family transcriptional regulator [Bacteroidota bacterium]
FDVILLDMNFTAGNNTGNEGIFWMREILKSDPDSIIIFITAYGDVNLAVKSLKEGATDFILKSWDEEKILSTILSAFKLRKSRVEIRKLKEKQKHLTENSGKESCFCEGQSDAMKQLMLIVDKVAKTDANILILGENGTGKEVIANEIHKRSHRADELFVNVNITSLSESLFESELFGHVQGAFTDAKNDRAGRFEIASGGTLFLDEIGDLPLSLQSKLLAAIQNREITRVGSHLPVPVDIRLISATNKNIKNMVTDHQFREDLFYRINTIRIEIPPLRNRPEDIPLLANYFLDRYAEKYFKPGLSISPMAMNELNKQPWPGNIRELEHAIEKAVIMCDGYKLTPGDFFVSAEPSHLNISPDTFNLAENEKHIILKALAQFKGNVSLTAGKLGINRTTLYEKMKKYGF